MKIVEVGRENSQDTTSLANTPLVTETSKSNGDDQVPTSYNKNADISSKDEINKNNVFESMNSMDSFFKSDTQTFSKNEKDDGIEDFTRFYMTTTTLDPIAAILEDVVIVDASDYLPKGYVVQPEKAVEELAVENKNINLLAVEGKSNDIKFKPGKLHGKKLAAIAKELKEANFQYQNVDNIVKMENNAHLDTISHCPKMELPPGAP